MSEPKPLAEFQGKGITDELERRVAALEGAVRRMMDLWDGQVATNKALSDTDRAILGAVATLGEMLK